MARIKRMGLGIMGAIVNTFRAEEVLPNEFSELKSETKIDYIDFML
ncbi:hypothetical protein PM10SUCC1_15750 [Propionigenium maris DSM 9537]|uniref:Uncharacterized protein n=1 Tax=Propionigenium maris DSM 9537 TaxID=1123000 RepID=A0A9W6GLS2_9FUSO|nr:hypothetical protein [Propionigenium maris]GLI56061.1 hypothetical protein PM10SUCC1_15750 [Propionigenium maris DSM 9537]